MSQSVEAPASSSASPADSLPDSWRTESGLRKKRSREPASAILFNELVLARFRWFALNARFGELGGVPGWLAPMGARPGSRAQDAERAAAEREFRETLDRFTDLEGEIVAAYWSATVPSGVVMTMRRRRWPLRPRISLHRATSWLTGDSRVAELLHHCDTLGNKAAEILRGTPKRVAMTWIFSTESYLLGVVEERVRCATSAEPDALAETQTNGRPEADEKLDAGESPGASAATAGNGQGSTTSSAAPAPRPAAGLDARETELVTRGRSEIVEIEKYYDRAAANAARFIYFGGMLAGAIFAAAAGLLLAAVVHALFGVIEPEATSTRFFFACYTAGALGAIVSVLTRMRSDRFALDYEVGRMPAFWLGTFRPFLGAVFGLVVYFALQSGFIQVAVPEGGNEFFFFTLFAFAAGFSERLTHVILGGAERTVAATLDQADKAVEPAATATAAAAAAATAAKADGRAADASRANVGPNV